ncbi:Nif3-like dinuclear metal center hexameric protein [uncultured Anaerofustis sp.]|uniref:Nif3-like dinuclear metal center hexameric protein n=1 Tax=uncultured Anaerofustis sp. TaxID=904996 RepID=UPI0025F4F6F8|nr:Nif3-like dinuclear metal center hexameric protein [uncultured Anaerofustis sp.]
MRVKDVIEYINVFANESFQYEWDNSGFQLGNRNDEVRRILITLDITNEVIDEAIREHCDMIISHHPLFFSTSMNIEQSSIKGDMIFKLIKNNINVYSAHTPMDVSTIGLNMFMAKKLGLSDIEPLERYVSDKCEDDANLFGLGAVGNLDTRMPVNIDGLLKKVKKAYNTNVLKVTNNYNTHGILSKVALCTGAGGDLLEMVKEKNAKVFITSDTKYHEMQEFVDNDIVLINVGHYNAEICFLEIMNELLKMKFHEIELIKSEEKNVESFAYFV